MSGGKKESIATLEAAFGEADMGDIQGEIVEIVNNFADRTQTEGVNTTELKKLDPAKMKSEINKEAKQVYNNAQGAAADIKTVMKTALKNSEFLNSSDS